MKNAKKLVVLFLLLLLMLGTGCWDYRGMNGINIVAGFAADKDAQTGNYDLTLEIVGMAEPKTQKTDNKSLYVETTGVTLFDAMRNSQKKLVNQFFFGNMRTIVISHQMARDEGILNAMDALLRDGEARETVNIVISQGETAREILMAEGLDMSNTSFQIDRIVEEDNKTLASTKPVALYRAYEMLQKEGRALVLPAFHCVTNDESTVAEVNGLALFRGDKLTGYLTPQEARYYLLAMGEARGGVINIPFRPGEEENVSYEIKKNRSAPSYSYDGDTLQINMAITLELNLMELLTGGRVDNDLRTYLEERTNAELCAQIQQLIQHVTQQTHGDIFGIGSMIYKKDPNLWESLRADWDNTLHTAAWTITVDTRILNTGITSRQ